jgi:UDP-4-amino-4,6-dideoxy-N-acetyl-beta-L-altrosamine transaminase
MIPYSRQSIDASDVRAVVRALRSPFITQGPVIARFEKALRKATGARYAIAFSSGTAALHGAYAVAGITHGDEVVTTPLTFAATANMILALGAKPIFADINPETGNLDPRKVEKKITRRTKAIVTVDYAGLPADSGAFRSLARKHKLIFIEDAAHALGATYRGKSVGTQADMTMFSFHPVKSITTGEGGAITTNSRKYYEKLLMFRSHGLTKDRDKFMEKKHAAWHQEVHLLGFNYRLTDIQAALGVSQMKKLTGFIAKRRSRAKRYRKLLAGVSGLMLPPKIKDRESAWHLFPIRVPRAKRDAIFTKLRKAGIGVQVHYLPVYLHPLYRSLGYTKGLCPKAEAFSFSEISLPLFPTITEREQRFIAKTLATILRG